MRATCAQVEWVPAGFEGLGAENARKYRPGDVRRLGGPATVMLAYHVYTATTNAPERRTFLTLVRTFVLG